MNTDEYREVINGPVTYNKIAHELRTNKSVLVGWTDQQGAHYDILFSFCNSFFYGENIQGGLKTDFLIVSIMRVGSFGFDARELDTHPATYATKLGIVSSSTADALAELINGVKKQLQW